MLYSDDALVEKKIFKDPSKYLTYLYNRLNEISNGLEVWCKPKIIYPDPISPNSGDIRPMTCFTDRVKVVKIIATNPIRKIDKRVSVGTVLSLDYEENFPKAIYDASTLSSIRTAAVAHLVMKMAGKDYDDVLLIGKGEVGKYFLDLSPTLHRIRTYDIKTSRRIDRFEGKVIITATTSETPFLTVRNCSCDLLISLGADTHFNSEISTSLLTTKGPIYVDTYDAFYVGDLSKVKNPNKIVKGELSDLSRDKNCGIFVSVGSPLMDALTIEYLEGLGEPHPLYNERK